MNEKSCATADTIRCWENIDFHVAEDHVKKLQRRIAKAYHNDDVDKVSSLQHRLIHSFYAKALAVNIVTTNGGRETPGVDNIVWVTSNDKWNAIFSLRRRDYNPSPLRRVYIDKPNGTKRPLSIPTMKDRAMQTLYKFALEPIAEISADAHSYGYRKGRSTRDAIVHCANILSDNFSFRWILEGDIESCFDNINHSWIIENIPMDKTILKKFLGCGYVENGRYHSTSRGIPQGGCLSSVICNMVLDGLESELSDTFHSEIHFVRYADDFVVIGKSRLLLTDWVMPMINRYIHMRGLRLSVLKTYSSHIDKGFDFLGWTLRRDSRNQLSIVPSRKNIDSLISKTLSLLSGKSRRSSDNLYDSLRRTIVGWINYHRGVVTLYSLYDVEYKLCSILRQIYNDDSLCIFVGSFFSSLD